MSKFVWRLLDDEKHPAMALFVALIAFGWAASCFFQARAIESAVSREQEVTGHTRLMTSYSKWQHYDFVVDGRSYSGRARCCIGLGDPTAVSAPVHVFYDPLHPGHNSPDGLRAAASEQYEWSFFAALFGCFCIIAHRFPWALRRWGYGA